MSIASILHGHEFFGHLGMEEVEEISRFSKKLRYSKDDPIFRYGERADSVCLLLKGSVLLRFPADRGANQMVVTRIGEGEFFGISPLLGSETYSLDAICAEDSEILGIEAGRLQRLLREDCTAGFVIMREVAKAYFDRFTELLRNLQGVVCAVS